MLADLLRGDFAENWLMRGWIREVGMPGNLFLVSTAAALLSTLRLVSLGNRL